MNGGEKQLLQFLLFHEEDRDVLYWNRTILALTTKRHLFVEDRLSLWRTRIDYERQRHAHIVIRSIFFHESDGSHSFYDRARLNLNRSSHPSFRIIQPFACSKEHSTPLEQFIFKIAAQKLFSIEFEISGTPSGFFVPNGAASYPPLTGWYCSGYRLDMIEILMTTNLSVWAWGNVAVPGAGSVHNYP